MNAQEIIDYIANSEKKTPVKLYVNTTAPVDFGAAKVFGGGNSFTVFGDWAVLAPILEANRDKISDLVIENDRRNSGVLKPDFDVELTETHHNQKEDAPSGSAKLLLEAIDPRHEARLVYGREGNTGKRVKREIGVHALRGGTVAGTHTVHFFGPDEELEFTHRAASRQIFVNGALHMARLLPGKPNGVYDLQKILFGE